jgi:hypothetical protein
MAVNNPRRDVNLFSPKIPRAGANMELKDIDLNNLDLFMDGDPYAAWKILREQAPLHWNRLPATRTRLMFTAIR